MAKREFFLRVYPSWFKSKIEKKKFQYFQRVSPKIFLTIWKENFLVNFWHNIPGNILFVNIITKNSPPRLIKKAFLNSTKFEFSNGINPWFWCKIDKFSLACFLGKKFLKIMLLNILKRKGEFQDNKNYLNIIIKFEFFQRGWPMLLVKK